MARTQIAIIGGGLVGASLALALQAGAKQRGWKITLVEPFAPGSQFQPSFDARASALSYGSQQIYQQLGIWEAIAPRAQAMTLVHVSDKGHFGNARLVAADEGVPALGYVIENAWLGHCLWQALDSQVIEWRCPAKVEHIKALADGYQMQLDDGTELTAELTILADGGRSNLREQLGVSVTTTPYNQTALITTVSSDKAPEGQAFERFSADGPIALLPLVDNRYVLIWTREPNEAERLFNLADAEFLHELQDCFGFRVGAFTKVGSRHQYPLSLAASDEQIRPHLVVLGNAAHSLHPVAGQGYNLSLRDTLMLAKHLLASQAPLGDFATLQAFQASQLKDQDITIGFSDRVTRLFSNNQPLLALGRNMGLMGLDLLPPAKHWFARLAMGLGTR
ncbi:2-octaprenyl-6-methoxyphenyl hydroxylase [Pseudomonas sp. F1_0610]|uniref:2-octaprenyl-6-methoxyphenyl hydroxylase n=1 Tax=Pseudomonas sp. F1_0610 TaxID=3114284 RepID=UPI0039C1734E